MGWTVKVKSKPINKEFTLGQILDAIEANGLPKANETYWKQKPPNTFGFEVDSACAIGQGALNLGVSWSELSGVLRTIRYGTSNLEISIIHKNDNRGWKIPRIGQFYKERFADRLNEKYNLTVKYEVEKNNA